MKDPHYIPQKLDEPFKMVLLTADELVVFLLPLLFLGFVLNALVIGFLLGAGGVLLLKKFKGEQGAHYWLYAMYWYLPAILPLRAIPPSYQRDYIG